MEDGSIRQRLVLDTSLEASQDLSLSFIPRSPPGKAKSVTRTNSWLKSNEDDPFSVDDHYIWEHHWRYLVGE